MNPFIKYLVSIPISLLLIVCGLDSNVSTQQSAATIDGVESTEIDGSKDNTITATDSAGNIAGTSLSIPGGTLGNTTITMQEGTSIAGSSLASELTDFSGTLSSASNSVVIESSTNTNPTGNMSLSIPLGSPLNLNADIIYTVAYKVIIYSEDDSKSYKTGLIRTDDIIIESGAARFNIKYFGQYQLAYTSIKIEKEIEQDTQKEILTINEAKKLPEFKNVFTMCSMNLLTIPEM